MVSQEMSRREVAEVLGWESVEAMEGGEAMAKSHTEQFAHARAYQKTPEAAARIAAAAHEHGIPPESIVWVEPVVVTSGT